LRRSNRENCAQAIDLRIMQKALIVTVLVAMLLGGRLVWADSGSALFTGPFISGSSVYSARDFAPDIAAHVGRPTSAAVLESLRGAIRNRYVRDGYVTPIISVPAQDLESTNPRIIIHEAVISAVEIRGNAGPYRTRIEQLAHALQRSQPLRKEQVRSVLRRISQLPGITSKPLFDQRPDVTNGFLLVLRVEYQLFAGKVELNNGGTRGLGRELLIADLAMNNLLGIQEQLRLNGAVSSRPDRYHYEEALLARRFDNTSVFADVSGSTAVPEFDTHFRDAHFSTGLAQQLQLAGAGILSLGASLNADNASIRDSLGMTSIEDHERSIAFGVTFARNEASAGRLYLGAQHGLDVAGSQIDEGANADIDSHYTKYLLEGEQVFSLGTTWSFQIDFYGQVTGAVLPVLERFTFGGIGFGAAFDPATLSGDSGAEVSAQLAHVIRATRGRLQYLRVYLRSDTGIVWNNSPYFYHRDEASSAGGGVLARWTHVIATLELSTPVEQPRYVSAAQSVRTFGSVAYVF
jgi:hemolysin activation/secretion protein